MTIDRREILAGLAAVAGAGVAPALPASAAPLPVVPDGFLIDRVITRDVLISVVRPLLFESWWHLHEHGWLDWTIRHVETGLTFVRRAPHPDASFSSPLMVFAGATTRPLSFADVLAIGRAALVAGPHSVLVRGCRSYRHEGAVFFRYSQVDPTSPHFSYSPPRPR